MQNITQVLPARQDPIYEPLGLAHPGGAPTGPSSEAPLGLLRRRRAPDLSKKPS
jgi:hypothetical protein